jgi:hypothetical protein
MMDYYKYNPQRISTLGLVVVDDVLGVMVTAVVRFYECKNCKKG